MSDFGKRNLYFRSVVTVIAFALMTFTPNFLSAASITFSGATSGDSGTGIGNTLTTLILQNNGSESGSILWNGTMDVDSGDASPASKTRAASELISAGMNASNSSIVLNINQTGGNPSIDLNDFTVRFFNSDATQSFDAVFDETTGLLNGAMVDNLTVAGQGTGTSGYLFNIVFDGNEPFDFFANNMNRAGTLVEPNEAISGSNDGPENFYFLAVPEPSMGIVWIAGLLLIFVRSRVGYTTANPGRKVRG